MKVHQELPWKHLDRTQNLQEMVRDKAFWRRLQATKVVVEEITKFINEAQSDSPNLSRMYKEWLALQQTLKDVLPDSRDNFLHDILKARAVHFDHPAILFSFHVDPVNVSHKLTKEH
jgi:hypothetical protein